MNSSSANGVENLEPVKSTVPVVSGLDAVPTQASAQTSAQKNGHHPNEVTASVNVVTEHDSALIVKDLELAPKSAFHLSSKGEPAVISANSEIPTSQTTQDSTPAVSAKPQVTDLMAEIRSRVKKEIADKRDKAPDFKPLEAQFSLSNNRRAGELLNSEELRYLNAHYGYSSQLDLNTIKTHRRGLINGVLGKGIVKLKRKVVKVLWDSVLKDYFVAEREFQANLVRYLNDVSKYVDARDASNFWELIRKVDVDISRALNRIERINDEFQASLQSSDLRLSQALRETVEDLQKNLRTLNTSAESHEVKLKTLDSVARGLEGIIARLKVGSSELGADASKVSHASAETAADDSINTKDSYSYLLLENRFRGGDQEIAARLSIYPTVFKSVASSESLPVLEIGAGRGELQLAFKQADVFSYGVDLDPAMIEIANSRGVRTILEDGIAHLRSCTPQSLSGVIAIQVVEHLTHRQIGELLSLCRSRVKSGGRVVFETINPQSLLALSSNYFRDPTHVWPMHPDTLSYAMTQAGFDIVEVKKLSPVNSEAQLRTIQTEEYMTPRWTQTISAINHNFDQLNQLIYGFQDYCVVAEVPAATL